MKEITKIFIISGLLLHLGGNVCESSDLIEKQGGDPHVMTRVCGYFSGLRSPEKSAAGETLPQIEDAETVFEAEFYEEKARGARLLAIKKGDLKQMQAIRWLFSDTDHDNQETARAILQTIIQQGVHPYYYETSITLFESENNEDKKMGRIALRGIVGQSVHPLQWEGAFYLWNSHDKDDRKIGKTFLQAVLLQENKALKHKIVDRYKEMAEQGNPKAQNRLGWIYEMGLGGEQSYKKAIDLYRAAAIQKHKGAQYNLALMYDFGCDGLDQLDHNATNWYRRSAKNGHTFAQYTYGKICEVGKGVPQSVQEAAQWYRLAANKGCVWAQYSLAVMLEKGEEGVPQNLSEAKEWYRKAAVQKRHAVARGNLARLY